MTRERESASERVQAMRAAFDAAFGQKPAAQSAGFRDFLAVRAGGARHAIRLDDITSLHADLRVASLPSEDPRVLGVAAIRSRVVAVYDLGALLGSGPSAGRLRWIALVRDHESSVAFEALEGHVRRSRESALEEVIELEGASVPVLDLGKLLSRRHA